MLNFIKNLKKKGKIKLVESNKNLCKSHDKKSQNCLKASKILLMQKLFEESVSLAYYSMYNKITSLFYLIGLKCKNHSASIFLLNYLFDFDNKKILFAKKERIDKQYYTDFKITSKDCSNLIELAEEIYEELDLFIENLKQIEIDKYKNKLKEI